MSKQADIIQKYNDKKREFEYFVKGLDVTESVKILLARHKEEYDKQKNVFAGTTGFLEAQMLYENKISDLEAKLSESEKPKEIRFNGYVVDCNYDEARKVLQEDILKMQEENKKLKESEELSNYAKCILENKKLEEDLELSEKCCVEYEQEISELKQQLAEKESHYEIIMPSRQNGKTTLHRIKLVEWQNKKAIAELEKVKDKIKKLPCAMTLTTSAFEQIYKVDATRQIDNQIASLKKGVE